MIQHQADAVLNQANPVSGTEYPVLATTNNVRIISIMAQVTWTVQPTPLEAHVYIDGQHLIYDFTDPVSATPYMAFTTSAKTADSGDLGTTDYAQYRAFFLEGRSIRITIETTGGTSSNLSAKVKWAKIP